MCGIAGLALAGGKPVDRARLESLAGELAHRGPDGQGFHVRGSVGLAQTRLAIIDLAGGDQPLYEKADGGVTLVANGEIYNDREIRAAMSDANYLTGSDCETPLRLYLKHGLEFARQLRGMYAIAIDDPENDRVVLVRDPFGIKPLYYARTSDGVCFASEPAALLRAGLVDTAISETVRLELLQLQFTTGPDTMFEGVRRVLPGEMIVIKGGAIVERRRIDPLPEPGTRGLSEEDAVRLLDQYLEESVDLHQRADVDYGMFLSGGIDSSVLLTLMARLNVRPVKTFTVGFDGAGVHEEREMARRTADHVGADHESISFGEEDFWQTLPAVAGALDDPVCDYAALPTYKLAAAARASGLKVILSGEGGDEMFAGYGRYRRAARWKLFGGRPMRASGALSGRGLFLDPENERADRWRAGIAASERRHTEAGWSRLQVCQAVDIDDWLPHDLLTKLDRCLMAHGVEGRVPFVDPVIADFALRLPNRLKVRGRTGKWLLRRWLEQYLPVAEPFHRKMGFTVPVGDWIGRRGAQLAERLNAQQSVAEIFHPDAVTRLFAATSHGGDKRAGYAAWTILFYAVWYQIHVAGRDARDDLISTLA